MNDAKRVYRETEETAKEAWRNRDGEDVADKVGNLGDDIRKTLGNAGDDLREHTEDAGEALHPHEPSEPSVVPEPRRY